MAEVDGGTGEVAELYDPEAGEVEGDGKGLDERQGKAELVGVPVVVPSFGDYARRFVQDYDDVSHFGTGDI